ncbi:MAG: ABC transporter permease [Bryobacterales bacterium]
MQLISKIYFPREILPLASVIVAFVDFLFATVVFAGLFLFYDIPVTVNLLWVAPLLLLQTVLILGIVFWVSALVVRFRDLRFVVPLTIQLWMYASPIIYPMSVVPDKVKPFYQLNPMAGLIGILREAVLRRRMDAARCAKRRWFRLRCSSADTLLQEIRVGIRRHHLANLGRPHVRGVPPSLELTAPKPLDGPRRHGEGPSD